MPVTVPREVGQLARRFFALSTPKGQSAFLKGVAKELRPEVRKMYRDSADPFGSAWQRRKDGAPAYQSKKMGNAIEIVPDGPDLRVSYLIKWIRAADEGHTFPKQEVKAESRFLTFDKRGRLIRREKALFSRGARAGEARRGVYQIFARAHAIGERVLTARPQQPRGRMPNAWAEAINRGVEQGMIDLLSSQSRGD